MISINISPRTGMEGKEKKRIFGREFLACIP
jgi:hypothetical protein